jgi:photosystem II stability/assembly factor-like uncharacterized protein
VNVARPWLYAFSFLLGSYASATNAGINQWTPTGPDGGDLQAVTWLRAKEGVALAAGGDSIYRTTDSGASWNPVLTIGDPFYSRSQWIPRTLPMFSLVISTSYTVATMAA